MAFTKLSSSSSGGQKLSKCSMSSPKRTPTKCSISSPKKTLTKFSMSSPRRAPSKCSVSSPKRNPTMAPPAASSPKRTKDPGVRVIGGRIYDSALGKTCHQCRQKTMDFTASCKQMKEDKLCTIQFCHKCLLNRYGEKAEEAAALKDWKCPKCRGVCNCSFCMKKRGRPPTGILVHTAKASGYSSVLDLLNHGAAETRGHGEILPAKRRLDSEAGTKNDFVEDANVGHLVKGGNEKQNSQAKKEGKRVTKRPKHENTSGRNLDCKITHQKEGNVRAEKNEKDVLANANKANILLGDNCGDNKGNHNAKKGKENKQGRIPMVSKKHETKSLAKSVDKATALPKGIPLTTVANIEWLPGDVGPVIQFLEFCNAFATVLDIKKGQPEAILREIERGRGARRGLSSLGQFHIKLLSLTREAEQSRLYSLDNTRFWLQNLGKFISESQFASKELYMDYLDLGPSDYDNLESSEKLRILNFLCDEALCTEQLRSWVDEENTKFHEKRKEEKEKIIAAKKKEKDLKQKMKDEKAKAMLSLIEGRSISISEHQDLLLKITSETEIAHAELVESLEVLPKRKECGALRTELILQKEDGQVYWRLGYYGGSDIMLQEIANEELGTPHDKWFIYDGENQEAIKKYIASLRCKGAVRRKNHQTSAALDSTQS